MDTGPRQLFVKFREFFVFKVREMYINNIFLLSWNWSFQVENGIFIPAFFFQETLSSMMISDLDPTGQVISDPNPDPSDQVITDPDPDR